MGSTCKYFYNLVSVLLHPTLLLMHFDTSAIFFNPFHLQYSLELSLCCVCLVAQLCLTLCDPHAVGVFSRGTARISGSLSCGAREVRSPALPQPAPARARTLEAGKRLAGLAQARAASRKGSALSRLGAELELRRSGSSLGPSQ